MLNANEFKAVMIRNGDRQEDIALAMGISPSVLSNILKGRREFRRNEIELVFLRYGLNMDDVQRIFFAQNSNKNTT